MINIRVEAKRRDVRTEDSRTEVFHTAIREAIGNPDEGHTTSEDTRTTTDDVTTIRIDIIAEAYAWGEERTNGWEIIIRDAIFLCHSRAIEARISCRTIKEEGHIDTQPIGQAKVISSLPLILSIEA